MEQKTNPTQKSARYERFTKLFIYIVVILLINVASLTLFFKIDLTSNGLYSLSKASKEAVSTLKEPLMVKVFFSKNLPAPWNNIEPYLHDLLDEYKSYAGSDFNYKFYAIDSRQGELSKAAEKNRNEARDYGINPINLYKAAEEEQKSLLAYMGMVLVHGDVIEKLPVIETTENLEYKITTAIRKMNNKISKYVSMDGKIKVTLVQSSSMNILAPFIQLKGLELIRGRVEKIVNDLSAKAYGKLEFEFIDPDAAGADQSTISRFNRFKMSWQEKTFNSGKTLPKGEAILALGLSYKNRSTEMKVFNSRFNVKKFAEEYVIESDSNIKSFIENNITTVMNINDDIGYLTSHGAMQIAPNIPPEYRHLIQRKPGELEVLGSILNQNFNVIPVDLKKGEISESIDTLIIAGVKEPFSQYELYLIDQFLMKGKSIALFADAFKELKQQNQFQRGQAISIPNDTGLLKLLESYGFGLEKAYVMDKNCFVNRDRMRGNTPIYYAPLVSTENINHGIPFIENITNLTMFRISPIKLLEETIKKSGISVKTLFSSSEEAWELKGPMDSRTLMFTQPPKKEDEFKQYPLAVIAEGDFPSYFNGRDIPKKPVKKEETKAEEDKTKDSEKKKEAPVKKDPMAGSLKSEKALIPKSKGGRVFLIGSAQILNDQLIQLPTMARTPSQSPLLIVNLIDYLNNKEDIAILRSKVQRFNPIEKTSAGNRSFIKVFNIGGVPILFVLSGIIVFFVRRRKRLKIKSIFENKE